MNTFPVSFQLSAYMRPGSFGDWVRLLSFLPEQEGFKTAINPRILDGDMPPEYPRTSIAFPDADLSFDASAQQWNMRWVDVPTGRQNDAFVSAKRSAAYELLLGALKRFNVGIVRV